MTDSLAPVSDTEHARLSWHGDDACNPAQRSRSALRRARRALAPRPALRATVARRPEAAEHDRPYHAEPRGSSPLGLTDMKGRIYDPLAGRFTTADPVMQAPFWSQALNRYSYVFNNPINLTDPSGFDAQGQDLGIWAGASSVGIVGGAALTAYGLSASAIAGGTAFAAGNIATPLLTGQYDLFNAHAGSTHSLAAPSAARAASGINTKAPGATGQNGITQPNWRKPDRFRDRDALAFDPTSICRANPRACAMAQEMVTDAPARILGRVLVAAQILLTPTTVGDLPPPEPTPTAAFRRRRWYASFKSGTRMWLSKLVHCSFGFCFARFPIRCSAVSAPAPHWVGSAFRAADFPSAAARPSTDSTGVTRVFASFSGTMPASDSSTACDGLWLSPCRACLPSTIDGEAPSSLPAPVQVTF